MVSILLGSFILLKQRNYNFFLIQLFCQIPLHLNPNFGEYIKRQYGLVRLAYHANLNWYSIKRLF